MEEHGWEVTEEEEGVDAVLEMYVGELFHYAAVDADDEAPWTGRALHTGLPRT